MVYAYPLPQQTLQNHAASAYDRLTKPSVFCDSINYWKIGNAFDTMTDYLLHSNRESEGPKLADQVLGVYNKAKENWSAWYDDFAWWGIACSKAFNSDYNVIFGVNKINFQKIAMECWSLVNKGTGFTSIRNFPEDWPYVYCGAPNVWDNRQIDKTKSPPVDYFQQAKTWAVPRFPGGVWQYEMFYKARPKPPEPSPSNPSDPSLYTLGPFQNTVMNALYLTLAVRLQLLKVDKTPEAGAAADREYDFLRRWINLRGGEKSEPDNSLFNPSGTGYLVRERVATYAEQNGKSPPVNGYNKDATWLGDQGLMLAAMAERHQLHPEAAEALGFAYDLWRGAHAAFKGRALTPTLKWPQEVGDDGPGEDYDFGKGVFWRSLLHAFNRSTQMRSEILATIKNEPDNFIYKSAEAACNTDLPEGATGDEALCNAFNVLATLTAADQILGWQQ